MSKIGKIVTSIFIVVNFLVLGWRHAPRSWNQVYWDIGTSKSPPPDTLAYPALSWVTVYGHLVGLDNRWAMYASIPRSDWQLIAIGIDADGNRILLPEPLQTPRTWFEREIIDFAEATYQARMLNHPPDAQRYASYLKRRYPTLNGRPTRDIVINFRLRPYVQSTSQANQTHSHWKGESLEVRYYPLVLSEPSP